jgi:hypothetical protein
VKWTLLLDLDVHCFYHMHNKLALAHVIKFQKQQGNFFLRLKKKNHILLGLFDPEHTLIKK